MAYATVAEPSTLEDGRLSFTVPDGSYGALPAWHTAAGWLAAIREHERLADECAGLVRPEVFLSAMGVLAGRAEPATGRGIAVRYADVADRLGVSTKTVQRCVQVAYKLGVLHLVLAGTGQMTLTQRMAVLDHYGRGVSERRWRELPNYFAAVLPLDRATRTRVHKLVQTVQKAVHIRGFRGVKAVDDAPAHSAVVHLPGGVGPSSVSVVPAELGSPFEHDCGRPDEPSGPTGEEQHEPPPAGATEKRSEKSRVRGRAALDPELEAYARVVRAQLPGFQRVSLARIAPALSRYRSVGLSPSQLLRGLNGYLAARHRTWMSVWAPEHAEDQARYLVGMITAARMAGFIRPPS